jgi:surface carbohydrate biosynthesis protein|tara:strand:+ start:2497 stop:3672 length:1176 start_codon:yes stop_codon:yes gene_type:complete
MKRLLSILRLILRAKLIFKNPDNSKIVVFDDTTIKDFNNILLKRKYFLLKCRIENIVHIYFSLEILKKFIKNYKGNIMTAYLLSVIELVNPKIVITHIDNSFKFSDLAKKLYKKIHFIAIQNAYRIDLGENKYRLQKKITKLNYKKKLFLPNFLCFGKFEIDLYRKHKINVKKFFIVGSLRLANYYYYLKKNKINLKKNKYDICLISESFEGRNVLFGKKNFEKKAILLIKFTIKFCKEYNKKLVFPLKYYNKNLALAYYARYLTSEEYSFLKKNSHERKNKFSSYHVMSQSRVSVAVISTLLSERLATNGKILSCNLTPTNLWDFPVKGICSIKNCNYIAFKKRLLKIYTMPEKTYFQKIRKNKSYLVDYKKSYSAITKIKNKINYFLSL